MTDQCMDEVCPIRGRVSSAGTAPPAPVHGGARRPLPAGYPRATPIPAIVARYWDELAMRACVGMASKLLSAGAACACAIWKRRPKKATTIPEGADGWPTVLPWELFAFVHRHSRCTHTGYPYELRCIFPFLPAYSREYPLLYTINQS
jgi:hypothetical protein